MKYSDIIGLQDYFHPVFNLQNEAIGYWKQFIPTTQFNTLLEKTLDAVSSNLAQNRKSIWVQGTFGTGKSHAGAVIKHLLCDDISEISDYIDTRIKNPNLKTRLVDLRNSKRYFSVVLSGVEGAHNPRTFALTLERNVKATLRKAGYQIGVDSDFERAIKVLEENPLLKDFDEIIAKEPELRVIAKSKESIIKKLKSADIELYLVLENTLNNYDIQLTSGDITQWLSEVEAEIRNQDIADGLLIFWDEFTSVMDTINSGLINTLQKIAELSEKQNIYLYLISHRTPSALGKKAQEDITKMNDRFHIIQYKMEAVTTYHIMAATLKKWEVNIDGVLVSYDILRDAKMNKFSELISYLNDNDSQQAKEDVKNLFPLHPYTAFLCSSLSDHIGSANRSVFNFMYDSDNGLIAFLSDENAYAENKLLTADCLWDFFLPTFLSDSIKYGMVTETYHTHIHNVEKQEQPYIKVFKGILLLNAMRSIFEKKQVLPSSKNIKYLFSNETFENELDTVLDYFDKNQIIQRDPSDNFLIAFSSLPVGEINEEKKRVEAHYKDALTIFEYNLHNRTSVIKHFEDTLIRVGKYCFLSSAEEYLVKSRLDSTFKNETYSLRIALFFALNEQERQSMLELVSKFSNENAFENIIFIVFNEVFENDEQQIQKFTQYVTNQQVATRHSSQEQAETNKKNANTIVGKWVNRLLNQGNYTLFFNGNQNIGQTSSIAQYINQNIGFKIFSSGIEIMPSMRQKPMSFYKQQSSPKSAEVMLCATDRNDAEKKFTAHYTPAKFLFKDENDDYVVEQNLNLKPDALETHPLVLVQKKVDELLEKAKKDFSGIFNLATILYPLTQAPFGLYSNIPNVAILAFALRKYQTELYNADVGVPITPDNLRDKVVDLFNFWQNGRNENKLRVRFGSKEEKVLKEDLIKIFDLHNVPEVGELTSIKNVRWGIAFYCRHKSKYPLWSLKYSESSTEALNKVIDLLVDMVQKDDTTTDQIKKVNKAMQEQELDLQKLLLTSTAFENGFRNFINKIESVKIENDWWNDLSKYLSERMPNEIGWWKESDVESKVKDFYIKKVSPAPQPKPYPQPENPDKPSIVVEPQQPLVSKEKVNTVRNRITQANLPTPALKWVLVQVLDNFPETADLINENLG